MAALSPLDSDAGDELASTEKQSVTGDHGDVHREEDEEALVFLPDAIVDPGTVVVHLTDAALTDTAVMSPLRFDAAAFWTFVDDFARLQLQTLHELLSGVSFGNGSRVGEHGAEVGGQGQHSQDVEDRPVDDGVAEAAGGQQHDEGDHKVSEEDQEPGDEGTHHAAAVLDEPQSFSLIIDTLYRILPVQQGALLLHISLPVA